MSQVPSLTAADIMQRDVLTVSPDDSLQEALAVMTANHVSGLPVLNTKDRCVGLISAFDILSFEREQSESASDSAENVAPFFDADSGRWESIRVYGGADQLPRIPVGEIMSRDPVSVVPTTQLAEIARLMVEEEIHRVLVLDDKRFLHGIISSSDFVRLFSEQ